MLNIQYKKQSGFSVLAVILVIVAVIVAIGVWALSGQNNATATSNNSLDLQAGSIINDSMAIQSTYNNLMINGAISSNITFTPNVASTVSNPNILDPVNGILTPKPNRNAIKDGANSFWLYNNNSSITGYSAGKTVIYITNVKDVICKRINYNLFGNSTIYISAIPIVNFVRGSETNPMVSGTPTFGPSSTGAIYGCFGNSTRTDENIFFRALN